MTDSDRLMNSWNQILQHSSKSTTLKFALARSLVDLVGQTEDNGKTIDLDKKAIARKFMEYYWFQVFRYHIRQTTNPLGRPKIVEILQEIWPDPLSAPRNIEDAKAQDVNKATNRIQKECFREVIPRFHSMRKRKTEVIFFISLKGKIEIPKDTAAFIRKHRLILKNLVILQWILWLERINTSPRIATKIVAEGEPRRGRLRPFYDLLIPIQDSCFYCQSPLNKSKVHVDHVIPWDYIFEDSLWNLVLSCVSCNCSKSNALPSKNYLRKLMKRNHSILNGPQTNVFHAMQHAIVTFPGNSAESFTAGMIRIYDNALADGFSGPWNPVTE
jgi:hypothetical protein